MQSSAIRYTCVQSDAIRCKYKQVQLTYSKIRSMDEKAAARSSVILVQCLRKRESSSAYEIASPKAAGEAVTDAPV